MHICKVLQAELGVVPLFCNVLHVADPPLKSLGQEADSEICPHMYCMCHKCNAERGC